MNSEVNQGGLGGQVGLGGQGPLEAEGFASSTSTTAPSGQSASTLHEPPALPWRKAFTHYTDDGRWVGEVVAGDGRTICEYVFEEDADLILSRVNAARA